MHLVLAGMLALFIGLVMFTTADMDLPYQGSIADRSGRVRARVDQIEQNRDAGP